MVPRRGRRCGLRAVPARHGRGAVARRAVRPRCPSPTASRSGSTRRAPLFRRSLAPVLAAHADHASSHRRPHIEYPSPPHCRLRRVRRLCCKRAPRDKARRTRPANGLRPAHPAHRSADRSTNRNPGRHTARQHIPMSAVAGTSPVHPRSSRSIVAIPDAAATVQPRAQRPRHETAPPAPAAAAAPLPPTRPLPI